MHVLSLQIQFVLIDSNTLGSQDTISWTMRNEHYLVCFRDKKTSVQRIIGTFFPAGLINSISQ